MAVLWLTLTATSPAHIVGTKERVRTPALKNQTQIVKYVLPSPLNSVYNYLLPHIRSRRRKREAKKLEATPSKDSESLVDLSDVAILGAVDQ